MWVISLLFQVSYLAAKSNAILCKRGPVRTSNADKLMELSKLDKGLNVLCRTGAILSLRLSDQSPQNISGQFDQNS